MIDRAKYFRRRQFVLGSEFVQLEGWRRIALLENRLLSAHPDLPTSVLARGDKQAVLLGYIIDSEHPNLDEQSVLARFLDDEVSVGKACSMLHGLSGRFALLVSRPEGAWLFPDACALRQVHYCRDEHGSLWCASQAESLAERFGFEYADDVLSYRRMPTYRDSVEEFWLLNDRTPYREVRCLLANHYLDLRLGAQVRFWPERGCLQSLSVEESIRRSTPILQDTINAATRRFRLHMGISAGSDSRRTLAASREARERIVFYTHTPKPDGRADMEIPARLLPRLGLKHKTIALQQMSADFRECYESSATWAREGRGHIAFTTLSSLGPEATVMNSNLSEIPQCYYWLPRREVTGRGLAMATRLNHPFAIAEFQRWLDDAEDACSRAGMNVLTQFDIELRSRWVAAALSEYDIAHETFNPYNNRNLLSLDLAVDERYRRSRQKTILIRQIKHMWPEVLAEPINPPESLLDQIEEFVWKNVVHRLITPRFPIYDWLRYIKLRREFTKPC